LGTALASAEIIFDLSDFPAFDPLSTLALGVAGVRQPV
jgi:hypothetical protein